MTNEERAIDLADHASSPRTRREQIHGVQGDVAAVRVLLADAPENVKREALRILLSLARLGA